MAYTMRIYKRCHHATYRLLLHVIKVDSRIRNYSFGPTKDESDGPTLKLQIMASIPHLVDAYYFVELAELEAFSLI